MHVPDTSVGRTGRKSVCPLSILALFLTGCNLPTEPGPSNSSRPISFAESTAAIRRRVAQPVHEFTPPCDMPAPLAKSSRPGAGYIFIYHDGVDARALTATLAAKYSFTPRHIYIGAPFRGFASLVTEQALASMRCEESIVRVEQEGLAELLSRP